MNSYRTYRLGRSAAADITIADPSVSRTHAELIATEDGRYYINDCGSRFGTHVLHNGRWKAIRQVFVHQADRIKLGEYETTVRDLIGLIGRAPDAAFGGSADQDALDRSTRVGRAGRGAPDADPSPKADLPGGEVERDPETGEIVRKA